ncbi:zinc-dependent alcohol dehydrogenase family protein [Pendulispora rubella]|uniref:Zinc-dependent alcohol dehydrogenase family protein n=1 Tax=Pendulispora rubella TaxID=2741070 RepID=A0ABZ2KUD9_9BACT
MKVLRFDRFGAPAEVLRLEDEDTPRPGADDVRVRLTSRAIHPSDLATIHGRYGLEPPTLPRVPGSDAAGTIVEAGANVRDVKPGDRVILLLGATRGAGTWREEVCIPGAAVVKTPETLPDAQAGSVWVNYLSAWALADHVLAVPRGAWVLQTAAGSQLGRAMMELSRLRGFRLLNVVRRREQVKELEALDAGPVVCTADDDFVARVRGIVGTAGLHFAVDAVGGTTAAKVLGCLAPGGQLVVFGALGGAQIPLDIATVLFKQLVVRGFWLRPWIEAAGPALHRQIAADILEQIARERIRPAIDSTFAFADFRNAVRHAMASGRTGAVVLT